MYWAGRSVDWPAGRLVCRLGPIVSFGTSPRPSVSPVRDPRLEAALPVSAEERFGLPSDSPTKCWSSWNGNVLVSGRRNSRIANSFVVGLATRLSLRHLTLGDRVQRLVGAVTVNLPARPDCRRTFGEQPHEASPTKCWVSWNGEVLYRRRAERTKTNNTVTLIVFVAPSPMSGTRLRPSIRLCLSLLPVVSYRVRVVLRSTHHRLSWLALEGGKGA